MRLINVSTMLVEEFISADVPQYAILSHTWEEEEVSLQDMKSLVAKSKKGYGKIEATCILAAAEGLAYAWVDTSCIDKSSSAELTEAINSMFKWYRNAAKCYVYLSDLEPSANLANALPKCKWFTRGWTLQELIAPRDISFFNKSWEFRGHKTDLLGRIVTITGIDAAVLERRMLLSEVAVARRMSWAALRQTTREEGIAYCLLGLFDVNMPLLYGEGPKAFLRLQEEIIRSTCDLSIFAWQAKHSDDTQGVFQYSGVFAESPALFECSGSIVKAKRPTFHSDFSVTNRGIRMRTSLRAARDVDAGNWKLVQNLDCSREGSEEPDLAIFLRVCGINLYVRENPTSLAKMRPEFESFRSRTIYIHSKLPESPPHLLNHPVLREADLIIGSRACAVKINLPPGFPTFDAIPFPMSNFDNEQRVFFTTRSTRWSWCVFYMPGYALSEYAAECLFVCMDWDVESPSDRRMRSTIVDASKLDPGLKEQFISVLAREKHDSMPWVLDEMEHFGISRQDSATLRMPEGDVKMSFSIRKVSLPEVCKNETYQVDFDVALV